MPVARVGRRLPSEESEVDIEVADEGHETTQGEDEEVDEQDDEEAGQDDELEDDSEVASVEPEPQPRLHPLKIKLKLGAPPAVTQPPPPRARAAPHRAARRPAHVDVESEDEDGDDDDDDEVSSPMTALAGGRLTARQAALASASAVDSTHVSLDSLPAVALSTRKRGTSPSQVALRKEENARKRKNMIEKKLEDEKLETINRLLKKQSKPKGKKGPALAPAPVTAAQSDEDIDMDRDAAAGEQDNADETPPTPLEPSLPMYRWLSTSRPPAPPILPTPMDGDADAMQIDPPPPVSSPTMSILFCVPDALLPALSTASSAHTHPYASLKSHATRCAVDGCSAERKYRAVGKEWGVGACGMVHLKLLLQTGV
ncbi:hypothetical protein C8F01DRAFT_1370447 [Mycena amicta]|nr:hypothetical protein C8F01DRAFT_1370447 [Mycena amicta]